MQNAPQLTWCKLLDKSVVKTVRRVVKCGPFTSSIGNSVCVCWRYPSSVVSFFLFLFLFLSNFLTNFVFLFLFLFLFRKNFSRLFGHGLGGGCDVWWKKRCGRRDFFFSFRVPKPRRKFSCPFLEFSKFCNFAICNCVFFFEARRCRRTVAAVECVFRNHSAVWFNPPSSIVFKSLSLVNGVPKFSKELPS